MANFRQEARRHAEDCLSQLISGADPLLSIWHALEQIWETDNPVDDVNAYFLQREAISCAFEGLIREAYWEIYTEIIRSASMAEPPWQEGREELTIIVDGMSLREAELFSPLMTSKGYEIERFSFSLSALPSDTVTFCRKFLNISQLGDIKRKKGLLVSPKRPVPQFFPQVNLVWLRYPDVRLHEEILSPSEVFSKAAELLFQIFSNSHKETFLVTADHGYVYAENSDHVWDPYPSIQKELKSYFGGKRFTEADKEASPIIKERSLIVGDYRLVRGRYLWPRRGSNMVHGGISFLECLVPVLKVRRL